MKAIWALIVGLWFVLLLVITMPVLFLGLLMQAGDDDRLLGYMVNSWIGRKMRMGCP